MALEVAQVGSQYVAIAVVSSNVLELVLSLHPGQVADLVLGTVSFSLEECGLVHKILGFCRLLGARQAEVDYLYIRLEFHLLHSLN